jgi:hypothetical protein
VGQIVFASPVVPDKAIVHDNEIFVVQWKAFNAGDDNMPSFVDRLQVLSMPEGCPGSDDVEHEAVFDSQTEDDQADFTEAPVPAGNEGRPMAATVGPFAAGAYRLTVTLDVGGGEVTTFNCIDIVAAV